MKYSGAHLICQIQDIPEVILSQKFYMNMDLIFSHYEDNRQVTAPVELQLASSTVKHVTSLNSEHAIYIFHLTFMLNF